MKQALDALEYLRAQVKPDYETNKAITALRAAIEQAEPKERYTFGTPLLDRFTKPQEKQEPVAWISKHGVVYPLDAKDEVHPINDLQPLYTAPQRRELVGLTGEEIGLLTTGDGWSHLETPALALFARAIEAKLKENNA